MREMLAMGGTTAAALLLVALVVFVGGDRTVFVPVPEAVAESFTREIATRRFDLAMKFLASAKQRSEAPQTLAARFDPLAAIGKVNHITAEPQWIRGDRAAAKAIVEGTAGTVAFDFGMVRENGLWKIDQLPDVH